ncbi:MAG: hypothetical protein LBR13_01610 [Dysgonamonadaceae bacterium]|jgi:hypothetical protein|nr:hypothetical protein [Dysgonamonadaceae bacterium]
MKKSVLLKLLLSALLLLSIDGQMHSQGLYSRKNAQDRGAEQTGDIILRANRGDPDNWIDAGGNDTQVPVGEGVLILSLLAGGYALIKKRNIKKANED